MRILWRTSLNRLSWCVHRAANLAVLSLGPVLIIVACTLISLGGWVYFTMILPYYYFISDNDSNTDNIDSDSKTIPVVSGEIDYNGLYILQALFGVYILLLTFFNYAMAVLTKPGGIDNKIIQKLSGMSEWEWWEYQKRLREENGGSSSSSLNSASKFDVDIQTHNQRRMHEPPTMSDYDDDSESGEEDFGKAYERSNAGGMAESISRDHQDFHRRNDNNNNNNSSSSSLTPPESSSSNNNNEKELHTQKSPNCKVCRKCHLPKPERSHHCSVCRKCVLRMDHHCPWIANCVGHHNHRYFFLFLVYLWVASTYFVLVGGPLLSNGWFQSKDDIWKRGISVSDQEANPFGYMVNKSTFLLVYMMAAAMIFAMGGLGGWHVYLVLTCQTTIEYYENQEKATYARMRGEMATNDYDLGTWRNLKVFFNVNGRYTWAHIFLPIPVPPFGDGTRWLKIKDIFSFSYAHANSDSLPLFQ